MKKLASHLGLAALALFYTAQAISFDMPIAEGECHEPDDYLSYPLEAVKDNLPSPIVFSLVDQFFPTGVTINTGTGIGGGFTFTPVGLLNPSIKWHNGKKFSPKRPNTHYTIFDITSPGPIAVTPTRDLIAFNQFGTFRFDTTAFATGEAQLLVPSAKEACLNQNLETGSSCDDCFPEGDHYLCYILATDLCPVDTQGRLEDQFQKNRQFDHLVATKFCTPANKTYNGNTESSNQDESNHLMCFSIGQKFLQTPKFVKLLNQFGELSGLAESDQEICVPTTKIDVTP